MHGSTDHLDPEVADEAEVTLRDRLSELFGTLVPAGHQGVSGVFHYSKGGPSDLRDPSGAPPAAPPPAPVLGTAPDNPQPAAPQDPPAEDAPLETPPPAPATEPAGDATVASEPAPAETPAE